MMHLSYDQQITLIRRLLAPLNVTEVDAEYLAKVVTHSDFTAPIPTGSPGCAFICGSIWRAPWWHSRISAV